MSGDQLDLDESALDWALELADRARGIGGADTLATIYVPALVAEVRRLRAEVSNLTAAGRAVGSHLEQLSAMVRRLSEYLDSVSLNSWKHGACWAAEDAIKTLTVRAEAAEAVVARIRTLHVPWYEVDGVRRDFTVSVYGADVPADHVCRVGIGWDALWACRVEPGSPEDSEHQVLACYECRSATEDGEVGHLLWPCPTVAALSGGA